MLPRRSVSPMAQIVGHTRHIGLGSVATLGRIGEALDRRGYSAEAIAGIMGGNWVRVLGGALPR